MVYAETKWDAGAGVTGASETRRFFTHTHALRGLAALWVVLFHVHALQLTHDWPRDALWYRMLFDWGRAGVPLFFVISGLVIAHSVLAPEREAGFGRAFAMRRLIRIDVPYVVAVVLATAVAFILARYRDGAPPAPSLGNVAAHLVYLQDMIGYPPILPIFWTLALEVQFYIVIVTAARLADRLRVADARTTILAAGTVLALGASSGLLSAPKWLFVPWWPYFFAGVLAWAVLARVRRGVTFLALVGGGLAYEAAMATDPLYPLATIGAAALLLAIERPGRSVALIDNRVLARLGAMSFSLYLVHFPVLWAWLIVDKTVLKGLPPIVTVTGVTMAAIGVAAIFWRLIERPAQVWAARPARGGARLSVRPISTP